MHPDYVVLIPGDELVACPRVNEYPLLFSADEAVNNVGLIIVNLRSCVAVRDPESYFIQRRCPRKGLDWSVCGLGLAVFGLLERAAENKRGQLQVERPAIEKGVGLDARAAESAVEKQANEVD